MDGRGDASGRAVGGVAGTGGGDRGFLRSPDGGRAASPDTGDRVPERSGVVDAVGGDRRTTARGHARGSERGCAGGGGSGAARACDRRVRESDGWRASDRGGGGVRAA